MRPRAGWGGSLLILRLGWQAGREQKLLTNVEHESSRPITIQKRDWGKGTRSSQKVVEKKSKENKGEHQSRSGRSDRSNSGVKRTPSPVGLCRGGCGPWEEGHFHEH